MNVFFEDQGAYRHGFSKGNVIIGNDVWIGGNVIILSGVKIGDGSVLANGSIITSDVEPYAIVGGNPARLIKYRFSGAIRKKLLEFKWWEWPEKELRDSIAYFLNSNIDTFLKYARNRHH